MIMAKDAVEIVEHPHGFHGVTSTLLVREEHGPEVIAKRMQPAGLAVHIDAGLISVEHILLDELSFEEERHFFILTIDFIILIFL